MMDSISPTFAESYHCYSTTNGRQSIKWMFYYRKIFEYVEIHAFKKGRNLMFEL